MREAIIKGTIVGLGVLLQVGITLLLYLVLIDKIWWIHLFYSFLGFLLVLGLIRNSRSYSNTLPWIIILLLFPLVGTLLYVIIGKNKRKSKLLKRIIKCEENSKKYYEFDPQIQEEIKNKSHLRYITEFAGYPITKRNSITYFPLGEEVFVEMLNELRNAKEFIFIEYFIIARGTMWHSILDILKEKVQDGVLVRVMYDDAGCISTLNSKYAKELEKLGIECAVFNPLDPISGMIMNHRDHRKILIIDGKVAFSGGINIADEYINIKPPYGHWKDNGIKIQGEAVWSYTIMFLTLWDAVKNIEEDYFKYKRNYDLHIMEQGYAIPYAETPLDDEIVGEDIYLNIINRANRYITIFTPYLIIDTDLVNALILAAKRGVDVRVVIPGIPDKKIVYTLSESYIETLVKGGVKIYKYTPGFIHAKVFISDDEIATVGTLNLDYRSLYLHFECGLYLENHPCIHQIKKDVEDTILKSHEVTVEEATPHLLKAMWQAILRLLAPLL